MTEIADQDARLLRRMADGDGQAAALIYRRYLPLVLRWALQETRNREVAADLASEIFAAALIASPRYRPSEGTVGSWLLGIGKNKLRESWRRRRVEDSARRRLHLEPVVLTDAALERVEELASLDPRTADLVAQLPPDQRAAVMAHVVEERSYDEIATELSCSPSVIRQRVSRGLRTLRSELEGS